MTFGRRAIRAGDVRGKRVLEVGAIDVNGSLQPDVLACDPAEFVAIDIADGPGVTRVLNAHELWPTFGDDYFDLVYTTEMFEHVADWRRIAWNMVAVLKPGGLFVMTTRAPGFPVHNYPADHWRYTAEDLRTIFASLQIESVVEDRKDRGAFIAGRRKPGPILEAPVGFRPHEVH